jgi:hypothetical protein
MKDATLTAALRHIGKRPSWTPAREYFGDRPNLNWIAFLPVLRLPRRGLPKVRTTFPKQ